MARRFIDLSIPIENEILSDPPHLAPKVEYQGALPPVRNSVPGASRASARLGTGNTRTASIQICPVCSVDVDRVEKDQRTF